MVHFLIIWRYLKNIFWFISVVCCYLALKRGIELAAPTHSYTYTPYLSHTLRGEREREKDVGDGRLWRQEAERRGDVVKYTPAIGSSAWLLCISRRTLSCSISISADSAKLLFCHFCLIFFVSSCRSYSEDAGKHMSKGREIQWEKMQHLSRRHHYKLDITVNGE